MLNKINITIKFLGIITTTNIYIIFEHWKIIDETPKQSQRKTCFVEFQRLLLTKFSKE